MLRVFDLTDPSEIILVRDSRTPVWQVTRGDQGTIPVAHDPGFEVYNAISAAGLGGFAQGVPSGHGLVLPHVAVRAAATWQDAAWHDAVTLRVPGGEAGPGAVYEALVWGAWHSNNNPDQDWELAVWWGANQIGSNNFKWTWAVPAAAPARWRAHTLLNVFSGAAHANTLLTIANTNAANAGMYNYMIGPAGSGANTVGITTATAQDFRVVVRQQQNGGGQLLSVLGGRAWKSA